MKNSTKNLKQAWHLSAMFAVAALVTVLPDFALAADVNTPMGAVLCNVTEWLRGNTGKGLATIAVTVIGIGALLGKVSWGMAILVGVGVGAVFGAPQLVDAMNVADSAGDDLYSSGCENTYDLN